MQFLGVKLCCFIDCHNKSFPLLSNNFQKISNEAAVRKCSFQYTFYLCKKILEQTNQINQADNYWKSSRRQYVASSQLQSLVDLFRGQTINCSFALLCDSHHQGGNYNLIFPLT